MQCLNQRLSLRCRRWFRIFLFAIDIDIVIVIDSAHLNLFFSDALRPLATKLGQLISQLQSYVQLLLEIFLFNHNFNVL